MTIDNVRNLWATEKDDDEPVKKGGNQRRPRRPTHPTIGTIYAGVYDRNKQRTTMALPMETMDRIREYNARWKGTPFESAEGLVRHCVLNQLTQWDEMGVELPKELLRWMAIEKAETTSQQNKALQEKQTKAIVSFSESWETIWLSGDRPMLVEGLREARENLGSFSPVQQEKVLELIERYEERLNRKV